MHLKAGGGGGGATQDLLQNCKLVAFGSVAAQGWHAKPVGVGASLTHLKNCGGGGMHVALHAAIVGYVPFGDCWHGAVPGGGSTTQVNIGGGGGGGGGGVFGGGGGGGGGGDAAGGCGHSQDPQHAQLQPVAHRWQQHASGMHMSPVSKRPVSMVWWSSSGH